MKRQPNPRQPLQRQTSFGFDRELTRRELRELVRYRLHGLDIRQAARKAKRIARRNRVPRAVAVQAEFPFEIKETSAMVNPTYSVEEQKDELLLRAEEFVRYHIGRLEAHGHGRSHAFEEWLADVERLRSEKAFAAVCPPPSKSNVLPQ